MLRLSWPELDGMAWHASIYDASCAECKYGMACVNHELILALLLLPILYVFIESAFIFKFSIDTKKSACFDQ